MIKAWGFRIMLLVMGLTGLASFLADFVDYRAFQVDGTPAVLQQSSKASPPGPAMFINVSSTRASSCRWADTGSPSAWR